MPKAERSSRAFTLVELLVVIAIVALLVSILVPSLSRARGIARRTVCLANLHGIGAAIHAYAAGNNGCIPFGPKASPPMAITDFYPSTGAPTSLISHMTGKPVGLGLMLERELYNQPRLLFCPGSDQRVDADAELSNVGRGQAQCSYYYRHASVTLRYDTGPEVMSPDHIRLDGLGFNRQGQPIRALVMDTQFLVPPHLAEFGVRPRTHHREEYANVLYADGGAVSLSNADGRFTVNLTSPQDFFNAFDRILRVLEQADPAP